MNAIALLKKDHKKVAQLFEELESASQSAKDRDKCERLFEEIANELTVHAHIEEKFFYPATKKKEETKELTMDAIEEQQGIKDLIEEILELSIEDDKWIDKVRELKAEVENHVEEEESELFPKTEKNFTADQLNEMGEKLAGEKEAQQNNSGTLSKKPEKSSSNQHLTN